jgi:hypothetical protein
VALADKIKTVEDGNLLELVRDVPSRTSTLPESAEKTGGTWMAPVSHGDVQPVADPMVAKEMGTNEKTHATHAHEREGEQEDYLWGV